MARPNRLIISTILLIGVPMTIHYIWANSSTPAATTERSLQVAFSENASVTTPSGTPWQKIIVQEGDSLSSIFNKLKLGNKQLILILKSSKAAKTLKHIHPGQILHLQINPQHKLLALQYPINSTKQLLIIRDADRFRAKMVARKLDTTINYAAGTIHHSLIGAAMHSGLTYNEAAQLAKIFAWPTNGGRRLRAGDQFHVLYQTYYQNGKRIRQGDIVAATLTLHGKTYDAIRFTYPRHHSGYFTPKGTNLQKSFLRTPVHYKRISSPFNLHRWHPLLHIYRAHLGVDLAAYRNTPVHATADGYIKFIGREGGYGNLIVLQNGPIYSTRYGHLAHFAHGMHRGRYVHKGEVIAYVGCSGLCTGPHLHYEFRIHHMPRNPMTVKLPNGMPIPRAYRTAFHHIAKRYLDELTLHQGVDALHDIQ